MKYFTVFLALAFLFSIANAQRKHLANREAGGGSPIGQAIVFNLATDRSVVFENSHCQAMKQGKYFILKVTNPNPLRYEISVTKTTAVLFTTPVAASSDYIPNNTPTIKKSQTDQATESMYQNLQRAVPDAGKINSAKRLVDIFGEAEKKLSDDVTAYDQFGERLTRFQAEVDGWKRQAILDSGAVAKSLSLLSSSLREQMAVFFDRNQLANPYKETGSAADESLTFSIITDFAAHVVNQIRLDVKKYDEAFDKLTDFADHNKNVLSQIDLNAGLRESGMQLSRLDEIRSNKADNDTGAAKLINDYNDAAAARFSDLANLLTGIRGLAFTSFFGPFRFDSEDVMTLKVTEVEKGTTTDLLKDFDGVVVRRQGGIKIDFSAGIFGTGLYDRSYTTTQSTRIVTDSTVLDGNVSVGPAQKAYSTIIRRGGSHLSYGPMAFVHFHGMGCTNLNWGGYFGTGFLFKDNAKPVVSVGGNCLIGSSQRLILGLGIALGSVTRLSSKYAEGQAYPESITDVPTESHIQASWIFTLSWNISK